MKIYLDIDGVILTRNGKLPQHLKEFLNYIINNHDVYWLTTHCKGDANYTVSYLSRFLKKETLDLIKKIKPTTFDILKTEAIDFSSDFLWLDDYLFDSEIAELDSHNKRNSWIKVDLKTNPNQLLEVIQKI